jgi:hypothetical protein
MAKQSQRVPTKAAAMHVGVSARTLEKARVVGNGPPFLKLFGRVVYDTDDLDKWMKQRRRRSTSDAPDPSDDESASDPSDDELLPDPPVVGSARDPPTGESVPKSK